MLDRNLTWFTTVVLVAAVGGRRQRRAALRGLVALALSSGASHLGRSVMGTSRDEVSGVRRTAAGVAVTAAAAIESPVLAAPGAGLLAAFALVRRPSQRPSVAQAVGGVALGMAAAAGTMVLWPRSVVAPPSTGLHRARRNEQPSPTGSGMSMVCNNASGRSSHRKELGVIRREFPDAHVIVVEAGATIDATIAEQVGRARVLGVIGGDGTIGTAAAAAHDADIPLAVFPGGTLNHFARDLGIESMDDAVAAVRSGEVLDVDVGVIDDHIFLNTASFGTYSEFVDAREQYEDRIGKWPAVMVALWRTVLWCKPLEVTIDGEARRVWTIFVGNCAYDPPGFAPATRCRLDDGQFDVRIIDGTHPAARLRLVVAVLTGRVGKSPVYARRLLERMDVAVESTVDLAADGEIFEGSGSFSVEKHPRPLKVFAPHA